MTDVTDRFAAMTPAEVKEYLATTAVLKVTALFRDVDEGGLRRLLDLDHFRREAVLAILDRFAEFCDDARLAAVHGVVRFDLVRKKRSDCHTVRFEGGKVLPHPDATQDVTIRAEIGDFVRLTTGQANAALLYLSGRLGIEGDELLALAVGGVFTVPGSDHVAVEPTTLDPVDVATAVAGTSSKHMRAVMAGGFRPIVMNEVVRRFPGFIDPTKADELEACIGFRVGGRQDGEVDRFTVDIVDGVCTVETSSPEGQRRDATITLEGVDFLKLVTGQLNPVRGVLTGALKVKGDRAKVLAFNAAMVPPQPRG